VLDVARRAGAPLANACGGVGCLRALQSARGERSGKPQRTDVDRSAVLEGFVDGERMACQAVVRGDCAITTTYW
jgi:ferredoxin